MGSTCLSLYFNGWLSPDFWYLPQDQFYEFLFAKAAKNDIKILFENKSKFLLVHSSSGHKHSLKEVLGDPAVTVRLADTKVSMCVCVCVWMVCRCVSVQVCDGWYLSVCWRTGIGWSEGSRLFLCYAPVWTWQSLLWVSTYPYTTLTPSHPSTQCEACGKS